MIGHLRWNSLNSLLLAAFTAAALCTAAGQGTFRNLDFEQANVPDIPAGQFGGFVLSSDGVPGWTTYIGTNQVTSILHNNESLSGVAAIAILGPDWGPLTIFQGNYTVLLQSSSTDPSLTAAIAQTGQVPQDAQSVRFYALESFGFLSVSFAGHQIPLVTLGSTSTYRIFGGDISLYANQTGELRFQGGGWIDNISFSSQPIPEPSFFGLLTLSTLLLGRQIFRRKASPH